MRSVSRTAYLASIAALVAASHAAGQLDPIPPGDERIDLVEIASDLTSPVQITHAGDGSGRLFIVEQSGTIRIVDAGGALLPTPFLDVTSLLPNLDPGFDERGLLGLAFHPDYAANGRFFIRYSSPRAGMMGEPCFGSSRGCHTEVLAEYSVSAGDPNVADPNGTILFEIDEPEFNHNSGGVAFGPDGFLYFTLGDGGGAHDGLAAMPPAHGPMGHGQNIQTHLGSMLRIDVDVPGVLYGIPAGNPFPDPQGRGQPEIFAYGFRNPYRFSFDDGPGGTGELYVADVGQNLIEELNIVEVGQNYGWVIKEGTFCFDPFNPRTPPASCPSTGPNGEPLIDPIAEYDHDDGISIIGGFVYRGAAHADLVGKYVFGDFSLSFSPEGRLFYIDTNGTLADIFEFQLGAFGDPLGLYVLGFGEGEDGELYVATATTLGPLSSGGQVWRIESNNCYPDCDTASGVGVLDVFDFLCFQDAFVSMDPYADCDGNTTFDVFDFLCFQDAFVTGCP
jgi:glucose/arabinose dehydrogenase